MLNISSSSARIFGKGGIILSSLNLLIVDGNEDFRSALEQELRTLYTVHHSPDGEHALAFCKKTAPDLIVLDLMLTGIDGIFLLQQIRDAGLQPRVLVVTKMYTDYVFEAADELGVDYVMRKPCQPSVVAQRVQDLTRRLKPRQNPDIDPEAYITEQLKTIQISVRHCGYGYLRESILLLCEHPDMSITKELYPTVAEQYDGVSWQQVERSIRSAIHAAWAKSGNWDTLLPDLFCGVTKCPTNGDVMIRIAECLRRKRNA